MIPETFVDSVFDSKVTEAFAKRLLDILNGGYLMSCAYCLLPRPRRLRSRQVCSGAACAIGSGRWGTAPLEHIC